MRNSSHQHIITGLLFAMLWASASAAGKFGLQSVEPLVLFTIRFLIAGTILLAYVYGIQGERLPQGNEWSHVTIFGLFNTTLYLGLFIIALQYVTPGITTLAIAMNPLYISVLSAIIMRRRIKPYEWLSIVLGSAGVFVAAFPLLKTSHATGSGLLLLALSMLTYSIGAVYYAAIPWKLSRTAINAWQVFIGGVLIAPFAWLLHAAPNRFDMRLLFSLTWLIIPVSILAVQLWLRLLKSDAVRASMWLYLCPIFGFLYARLLLNEPLSTYTFVGTAMVMFALYIGQRRTT